MTTYPTYTFTYAAIGNVVSNLVLYGGKYGYITNGNVLPPGTIGDTGTVVHDEIAEIKSKKSEMTSFLVNNYTPTTYNGGGNLTIKPIQTSNTYYVLNIPTTGIMVYTITFDDDGVGDGALFYIYNTGPLFMYGTMFELSGAANPANIYFLCDSDVEFYRDYQPYYGNFISERGFYMFSNCQPTLYGTASALGENADDAGVAVQTVLSVFSFLTIRFATPCFMEGTKILTDNWYTSVENLQVGDWVMTHGAIIDKSHIVGDDTPVQVRNIRKDTRKAVPSTSPIMVTKHAFGINKPFEDLYVSPNHGIINSKGQLYPAKKFINDTTIFQNPTIDLITYYHIELDGHFAITANGIIAESYLPPKWRAPPSRSAVGALAPAPQTLPPSTIRATTPRR